MEGKSLEGEGKERPPDLPNAMQIAVGIRGAIIIDHNVHSLDINPTSKDISGHKDALFESLECRVPIDTNVLVNGKNHPPLDDDVRTAPLVEDQNGY